MFDMTNSGSTGFEPNREIMNHPDYKALQARVECFANSLAERKQNNKHPQEQSQSLEAQKKHDRGFIDFLEENPRERDQQPRMGMQEANAAADAHQFKQQLDKETTKTNNSERKVHRLQGAYNEQLPKLTELKKTKEALCKTKEDLGNTNEKLAKLKKERRQAIGEITSQLHNASHKAEALKKQVGRLKEKIAEKDSKNTKLQKKCVELETKNATLRGENAILRS